MTIGYKFIFIQFIFIQFIFIQFNPDKYKDNGKSYNPLLVNGVPDLENDIYINKSRELCQTKMLNY